MSTLLDQEKQKTFNVVLERLPIEGYDEVIKISCKETNLLAIVAIHDMTLGSGASVGGTRIYPYKDFDEALVDVLRLSKGMTYKSAIASVGFGGAKSVIIADPKTEKTEELLTSFAIGIHKLKGKYVCAEDVGCSVEDINIIKKTTPYVTGIEHLSGNPSRFTAWGTFRGMQATINYLYNDKSLEGKKVLIQGVGSVGKYLLEHLYWEGAEIYVSDVDKEAIRQAVKCYGAIEVSPIDVYSHPCDIFAPCAMGGVINDETIPQLRCRAVVGCANNQLLCDHHAEDLDKRNILYAPDFVVNSGGLLNVASELTKPGYHPKKPRELTHKIFDCLTAIYEIAEKNKVSTHNAALALAEYRIKYGVGKRTEEPYFNRD